MAEFVNPFSGMIPDRTLNDRELARAIRMAMAAEEEAIHMYAGLIPGMEENHHATE